MLVLEVKSRNRSVSQMGSSKVVYWPPRSFPSSYQQCSMMLSETWVMASTYSPDRALTYSHFRAKTKTTRILMRELLFADDSALVAHSAEEMQKIVDAFSDASKKFGLKINIKKTEVLYQRNSTRTREEDIMVDGNKLKSVLEFTYLGSIISSGGCIDDEIQRRMAKASASFGRLRQRLWNNHHVSMRVKGKIYRAIVLSILLAEAWTVYRRQVKKLHAFMMRHLRSIMRITWMYKVTNNEILEWTGLPSTEDLLDQKESPVDWTPREDVTSQATKATLNCLLVTEREGALVSDSRIL